MQKNTRFKIQTLSAKIWEKAWKITYLGFNPKCGLENFWKPQRLGPNPH
jgi:hypothetical protein